MKKRKKIQQDDQTSLALKHGRNRDQTKASSIHMALMMTQKILNRSMDRSCMSEEDSLEDLEEVA